MEGSEEFKRLWRSLVKESSRLAGFVKEASAADKPDFILRETEASTLDTFGKPGGITFFFDAEGRSVEAGSGAGITKIDSRVSSTDLGNASTRAMIAKRGGVPTLGNVMVHEFSHGILAIQGFRSTEKQAGLSECAIIKQVAGGRCKP